MKNLDDIDEMLDDAKEQIYAKIMTRVANLEKSYFQNPVCVKFTENQKESELPVHIIFTVDDMLIMESADESDILVMYTSEARINEIWQHARKCEEVDLRNEHVHHVHIVNQGAENDKRE